MSWWETRQKRTGPLFVISQVWKGRPLCSPICIQLLFCQPLPLFLWDLSAKHERKNYILTLRKMFVSPEWIEVFRKNIIFLCYLKLFAKYNKLYCDIKYVLSKKIPVIDRLENGPLIICGKYFFGIKPSQNIVPNNFSISLIIFCKQLWVFGRWIYQMILSHKLYLVFFETVAKHYFGANCGFNLSTAFGNVVSFLFSALNYQAGVFSLSELIYLPVSLDCLSPNYYIQYNCITYNK